MTKPLTIYTHTNFLKHDTGEEHPENIRRLETLLNLFEEEFPDIQKTESQKASIDQITRAHPYTYVEALENAVPTDHPIYLDGDTILSPGSWDAALRGAGGVCQAIDDIMSSTTKRAFCASRPPGHHAEPSQAMGFCLFNNVFIGARHAQEKHNVTKIAIVDFDVHHGNGTDTMARNADNIFYISTHQYPLFPMTGTPDTNIDQQVLNILLPEGSASEEFRKTYTDQIFPELEKFNPDLLMISAGFDAHKDDPLAGLNVTDQDFGWITMELCRIADQYCDGKVVSVLEGGYNLNALKTSVSEHLKSLLGG